MAKGYLLTKSKYIRGLQCDRALWLDVHRPNLARYSAEQMRRFDRGRDFEQAVRDSFPNGHNISLDLGRNTSAYPEHTAKLLDENPEAVLFEAGFLYDDVLVLADIVCQRPDGSLDIFEIKSGSKLSDTYRRDAAIQHYVIAHCRPLHSFNVIHANPPADNPGSSEQSNNSKLPFTIVDLTDDLAVQSDTIAHNISIMKDIALDTKEPTTPTGQHCLEPYACPYQHYCAQGIRQLALF